MKPIMPALTLAIVGHGAVAMGSDFSPFRAARRSA